MRRKIIAILGDAFIEDKSTKENLAFEAGKALIDNGYRVQCGGLNGIMKAALKGARASSKYKEGDTIAIIPSFDLNDANEYADIVIPTGLDVYRNVIVANASAVIAIGGGSGTLCEMSLAWSLGRLIIGYSNVVGWSQKLANIALDERIRYDNIQNDVVYPVENAKEMIALLGSKIDLYNRYHKGIPAKPKS